MAKFTKIINKILSYDDPIYFQFPKEINEKIFINFKANYEKKNNNFKISIKELSNYYDLDKLKIVKLLNFNNDSFHHLLYNYDKAIILEKEGTNLSYIFYVALLIKNNPNIINYSFTKDLIIDIKNKKIENNNIYLELILSKVISDLIDAYKGLDEYNNNKGEIQEIETNNTNKIKNLIDEININKNELKLNMNLVYTKTKTIDQIYIDIIIGLLKNKSEDYKYIYNTITKMNLEAINAQKTMFEEIKNVLDEENGIMNKYLISKPEDLFDENKISFSYILLKYIFKSSIFIYQINFFLKVRNSLLELIKSKSDNFSSYKIKTIDQQIIDKLNYILDIVLKSEYYNNEFKKKYNNLKEDKSSNKSTEIDTDSNSKIIKTDSMKKINSTANYDSTNSNQSTLINSSIKNVDILEEKKDTKNVINNSNEDKIKSNKKVPNNNLNSSSQVTNSYFNSNHLNNNKNKNDREKDITGQNSNSSNLNLRGPIKYKICNLLKIIGEHIASKKNTLKKNYTAEFIIEINDIFISFGTNNEIIIYNNSYDKKTSNETEDWIYNVLEYKSQNNKSLNFLGSSKKNIYTFSSEQKESKYKSTKTNMEYSLLYLLNMESSYYFACCENTVFLYSSFLDKIQMQNKFTIYENILIKSAIKFNIDLLVLKSNKIHSKGKSKLLLYNFRRKKDIPNFFESNEEYSFVFSPLGQALIVHKFKDAKDDIENRILLFACKKYIKSQKNGILLLYNMHHIPEDRDNKSEKIEFDSFFYNTEIFEPYCICHLITVDTKKILEASLETKETDYFLVGGFEKRRKQGMIKLYKIIYGEKCLIKYIQDIKIFGINSKGFNGPISCITQSKKDGNLLITCWDGNVYLIDQPEISFYLEQDEQISKSAMNFFKKNDNQSKNNNNDK